MNMIFSLPPPVVVVLSEAFVSKPYPMEELELQLRWKEAGSKAVLLPVLFDLTYEQLQEKVGQYRRAAGETRERQQLLRQWAAILGKLEHITALRKDQVRPTLPLHPFALDDGPGANHTQT
jgi:hypothetical protein